MGANELEFLKKTIIMLEGELTRITQMLEHTVSPMSISNYEGQLRKVEQMKAILETRYEEVEQMEGK